MAQYTIRFNYIQHQFFKSALASHMSRHSANEIEQVANINKLFSRISQAQQDIDNEYELTIDDNERCILVDAVTDRTPEDFCHMLCISQDDDAWDDITLMPSMLADTNLQLDLINCLNR
jgi:hypothetical protein